MNKSVIALIVALCAVVAQGQSAAPRETILLDEGWRFALGNATDSSRDFGFGTVSFFNAKEGGFDGPAALRFNDSSWRKVNIPHDWAVELPFDSKSDVGHGGKPLSELNPATSVGWYRRRLNIPRSDLGRRITVQFDGAFRDAQVFLNGHFLGEFPSGYDGFDCNLTDVANYGGRNVLSVRLDATRREGWFYEGAGIYRRVWLIKTSPVHVATDGTFVMTEVHGINGNTADSADVTARATIANDLRDDAVFDIGQTILDENGATVAQTSLPGLKLAAGDSQEFSAPLTISHPNLWSLETPALYKLITTVQQNGQVIDRYETTFGVRMLRFDANEGFFLNGKHVLVKGMCNHQDHAGVGVAVPDALQTWRVRQLLAMGANADRTSHNPPAPEFLDACDKLGMLVLDENRQTGVSREAMGGLRKLIMRDRNHPSVFLWSVGNEEWEIEGNIVGERVVALQRDLVHRLDPSRLMTVAISGGWGNGSSNSVDVMGYNYFTHGNMDDYHKHHPDQPSIGTEDASTLSTRGVYVDDDPACHLSAYDVHAPNWGSTAERWTSYYATRPFVAGAFVWTGFDYRGEPTPFGWPAISSQFGVLDTCGFPKDNFYYYQSVWTTEPMVHILPHWNWPGKEGKNVNVWCFSNCDEVELFLNGSSLGRKTMQPWSHLEWSVPYAAGTLTAKAYRGGTQAAQDIVRTTGQPTAVQLIADRTSISADGQDVSVITVKTLDADGLTVPTASNYITFELAGPGRILGVGNGDPSCHEPDVALPGPDGKVAWGRSLFNGLAQVIVQSTHESGTLKLTGSADGLAAAQISIECH